MSESIFDAYFMKYGAISVVYLSDPGFYDSIENTVIVVIITCVDI